jgi:hypothetical protein
MVSLSNHEGGHTERCHDLVLRQAQDEVYWGGLGPSASGQSPVPGCGPLPSSLPVPFPRRGEPSFSSSLTHYGGNEAAVVQG